jgi:anthranilate phosphoribosyltransferase
LSLLERVKVAKHGNYGVSSISGSSNVMEKLESKFSDDADFLKQSIDKAVFVFCAPLFHPAMKSRPNPKRVSGFKGFF